MSEVRRQKLVGISNRAAPWDAERLFVAMASAGEVIPEEYLRLGLDAHVEAGCRHARLRFEQSLKSGTSPLGAYVAVAAHCYAKGRDPTPLALLDELARIDGSDPPPELVGAQVAVRGRLGDLATAEQIFERAASGRERVVAARELTNAYLHNGRYESAISFVRSAHEGDGLDSDLAGELFGEILQALIHNGLIDEAQVLYLEVHERGLRLPHDVDDAIREVSSRLAAVPNAYGRGEDRDPLQLVGAILSMVVHEIAQPLSSVDSLMERVSLRLAEERTEDARDLLETRLRPALGGLQRRIGVYKLFAQARSRELGAMTCSVSQVLDELSLMVREHVEVSSMTLSIQVDDKSVASSTVAADPFVLAFALRQLVGNALQALREGPADAGLVLVTARAMLSNSMRSPGERAATVSQGSVEFIIEDNGPGIPIAVQRTIHSRRYSTKGGGGMGLGVPLAYEVIYYYGGSLHLETSPSGTTWAAALPLVSSEPDQDVNGMSVEIGPVE